MAVHESPLHAPAYPVVNVEPLAESVEDLATSEKSQAVGETTDRALLSNVTEPIRVALALIYFYFGFLKFFADLSAAEMLATQTILRLRIGLEAHTALVLLAVFEVAIALALVLRVRMKVVFPVIIMHLAGTMAPLVLLPELMFKFAPFAPTLEGQYVIKNFILLAAGWALYRADQAQRGETA